MVALIEVACLNGARLQVPLKAAHADTPQFNSQAHSMRNALIAAVKGYRLMLSPWLGAGCRFEPTCSQYTIEALRQHGSLKGTGLACWRIVRCAPWCQGGHDPVPERFGSGLFTELINRRR